jgi:hypothetical protein
MYNRDGVDAWGGVGTLGGVAARGSVGALGGVVARGGVGALSGVSMRGRPLCPLSACQGNLVFVFIIVGQAGHNSASFSVPLFIVDNQWTPRA